ncbi:MAG: ATP-binding protein [Eubacteriaceae bacterium]|jgi:predicted AAA+ superfamily ATPase|nr:ATP-binding protein [Eubacteriaceae bacterium]
MKSHQLKQLVFYQNIFENAGIKIFIKLLEELEKENRNMDSLNTLISSLTRQLITEQLNQTQCYHQEPWKNYILSVLLTDESPINLTMEAKRLSPNFPYYPELLKDMAIIKNLFFYDWSALSYFEASRLEVMDRNCLKPSIDFQNKLTNDIPEEELLQLLNATIFQHGVGVFRDERTFSIKNDGSLKPIVEPEYKRLEDIVGNESKKKELIKNTAAFIAGKPALNVLLQGDMGTGKSTMVKALVPYFKDSRLILIEVKKNQLDVIPALIDRLEIRPFRFILFLDDISFEENEVEYKLFKNIMEGSLEETPDNVLLYATSNKRHLVTETFEERDKAVHKKDVMEEKLSLSSRFGLVLHFVNPNQKEYLTIVKKLAKEAQLKIKEEDLIQRAIAWELRHLNRSGRTATQLVDYLKTEELSNINER